MAKRTAVPTPQESGVHKAVRTLHPGYFALVMATGIVSIAMQYHHADTVSVVLLWLTCVAYGVLVALSAARIAAFRADFAADLADPRRGFGMFTFVAATNVLGTRLALDAHYRAALILLVVAVVAWMILGYVVPWTAVLGHRPRPTLHVANGAWFIWVVASQSVAVLAAVLQPQLTSGRRELALIAVFSWSVGVFLYAVVAVLVVVRMLMYPFEPADLTPPYWVAMGATAITVLAGARIVEMADAPMVAATRGLIAGASVTFWAFGSWLIPPLLAGGVWRHVVHRIPLRYDPTLWSIVFPLGMYGVGALYLGQADHLPIVRAIGDVEIWIALAAWACIFLAMAYHLVTTVRPRAEVR
ncbi:tellurite resistance/C4-dicarboxylate transporter family protein [Mycolicibacterium elephantis]|uniref:Tellurite resistance protein permease n=1 Tax=Mycolicibacterium elephantis TaxID=81858 RepID=A0A0M2ZR37_9MYCO|nr:tellurite resistance/C4-dicarboxylate transporter family protein [Mycolicibacterium elephantis]KKW66273.1 tellurite resistance protein permease [Mycolicibacterium elephantis]OBB23340.1 tellurite resistance protein permease [Mycolicibacterium elephantis]OBE98861.1 tellurite resistance protein permease [Mycolicibacterium elephantis]ORA61922.1 tellurite resistance protein permease [Mycolicibacterium elephantis]